MELSVSHQVFVFLCMILCGAAVGVVFDLFRAFRKCVKSRSGVIAAQDLLLWFAELCIVYATAFKVNNARIRGYEAIALVIGSVLYFITLSDYAVKFFCRLLLLIKKAVDIVLLPFKRLFSFAVTPLKRCLSATKSKATGAAGAAFSAFAHLFARIRLFFTGKKDKI